MDYMVIPLHGPSVQIVKKNADDLSYVLQSKFGCKTSIQGVDLDADSSTVKQKRAAVPPEKRCEWLLPSGVRVSVCKADLTTLEVDAVVNAANERLDHCGGLALALSQAGGPEIQKESDKYAPLLTGETIVTGAGRLPCNVIIHAVGPKVTSTFDVKKAEPLLERAIRNVLTKVQERNLQTVAIPTISSGLFNYPLPQCAITIVRTVRDYYDTYPFPKTLPTEILLANNDELSVSEMQKACQKAFPSHFQVPYSQAPSNKTRGAAEEVAVQLQKVHVILRRGNIEKQQTDIIVNTAATTGNLRSGQISMALLHEDGPQMQKAIYAELQTNHSLVIATKAHRLKCKEVYHTFCREKGYPGSEQLLYDSVKECLRLAQTNHKSIALPAIGTGNLGFSKEEVAATMLKAVADMDQKFQRKMEVHFVIYPTDHDTFQAFEKTMKSLQSKKPYSTPAPEDASGSSSSRHGPPQIVLTGPDQESKYEAKKWLNGLLERSSYTIHNNFIQHLNDEEHKQLRRLEKSGVVIEEFLSSGHACISLEGKQFENVAATTLQVEAMLCKAQERFVNSEQEETMAKREVPFKRLKVERLSKEFSNVASVYRGERLDIQKVEKVENSTLRRLFELKQKQLHSSKTQTMYQCIPAQFCEMVCRIGIHKECAPPEVSEFGDGIYFASSVNKAMKVWNCKPKQEYLYFVEAEVLVGTSTPGRPGLILPPARGSDPGVLYDSVEGPGVSVIFSGYQALPKYIVTCKKY